MIRADQLKAIVALGLDAEVLHSVIEIMSRPSPQTVYNRRYEAKKSTKSITNGITNGITENLPAVTKEIPPVPPKEKHPVSFQKPLKEKIQTVGAREGTNGHAYPDGEDMDLALDAYNQVAAQHKLPQARKLTETRRKKLKRRLIDVGSLAGWYEACRKLQHAKFLRGNNDKGWRADFDFLLQEQSFNRLLEGYYDDKAAVHSH